MSDWSGCSIGVSVLVFVGAEKQAAHDSRQVNRPTAGQTDRHMDKDKRERDKTHRETD